MINIFVSHAWADKVKDQFGQVYQELEQYDLWIDKTELRAGDNIRKRLREAITAAEVVLVLWSEQAAASDDVLYEIETATELNKIILPCVIDDYPLSNNKHLDGMLYIDLRETPEMPNAALGWMKLKYLLANLYIEKMTDRIAQYDETKQAELMPLLDDLKKSQQQQKTRISFLEDSLHRKAVNADGRNRNNAYMKNMLNTLIKDFNTSDASNDQKQAAELLAYTKNLFTDLPGDDEVSVKKREGKILEKIQELDPHQQNNLLLFFKEGLAKT